MTTCTFCYNDINIIYICKECGGSYCSKHKRPESHYCKGIEKTSLYETEITYRAKKNEYSKESIKQVDDQKYSRDEVDAKEFTDSLTKFMASNFVNDEYSLEAEKKNNQEFDDLLEIIPDPVDTESQENILNIKSIISEIQFHQIAVLLLIISVAFNVYVSLENSVLSDNYVKLYDLNEKLMTIISELESQEQDIMNNGNNIELVKQKTIILEPFHNYTEVYQVPFLGYIYLNYTATDPIYSWVGRSNQENSINTSLQSPETSSSHNITVPRLPDIVIYFANPNNNSVEINYWIHYTY